MAEKTNQDATRRLESWKAIANYLNRSVRTVRRWEQDEGLPVHRHRHTTGCSVFAFSDELDAWRAGHRQETRSSRDASLPIAESSTSPANTRAAARTLSRSAPSSLMYAVIGLAAVLVAAFGTQVMRADHAGLVHQQAESVGKWALVADVNNTTGIDAFDAAFASALRREITNSATHSNLPPDRIDRALRLMRQESDAPLTQQLARAISLRDGGVEVLLIPRAEQRGERYLLEVDIVNPVDGSSVYCESTELDSVDQSPTIIDQLVRDVTAALPAASIELADQSRPSFAAVTTNSLEALHHYQRALEAIRQQEPEASLTSLELAVEEDPDFFSARALQAWVLQQAGRPATDYVPMLKKAVEHVGTLMPEERYFIEGLYEHLSGDPERAAASYRTLLRIAPAHDVGAKANLALCLSTRSSNQCVGQRLRLADLHPDDFRSNIQAAWALAAEAGQYVRATPYADRALEILGDDGSPYSALNVARAHLFPVIAAWVDGDPAKALATSQRLQAKLPQFSRKVQDIVAQSLGEVSLAMGRLHEADALFGLISDSARRHELHASSLYARQDAVALRQHLAAASTYREAVTALLLTDAGLYHDALALLQSNANSHGITDAQAGVIRARIALQQGNLAPAQAELRQATSMLTPNDRALYFVGPDMLAQTLEADGRLRAALSILEMTNFRRSQAGYHGAGMFWLMCQHHLAMLYRQVGRKAEAAEVESTLRQMLSLADEDHPLRQALSAHHTI